jgi:6-pyruvoyltetrahydropterin/6-carboxytetrahydropterin synthase
VQAQSGPGRDVVLAAISELPADLRRVVEMRVTRELTADEMARELGLEPGEFERRIVQAEAILGRIIGVGFRLRYLPGLESPQATDSGARARRQASEPVEIAEPSQPDVASLITSSLSALTKPLLGRGEDAEPQTRQAQDTIREALREASELFRLAAEKLETREEQTRTLREMLRDEPTDEITLSAEGVPDTAEYTQALEALQPVQRVWLESVENGHAIYKLQARSVSAVVRGLLGFARDLRPQRLKVLGDEIHATIGSGVPAGSGGGRLVPSGPIYELGADAFFGARHFVTMNGVQGPPHHHSYRVEVLMESGAQSDDGVVMGFGEARSLIETIVLDYNETLLNTVPPFDETQPTAENISRVIYERLATELAESPIRLKQVRVWESPTNSASYSDVALAR